MNTRLIRYRLLGSVFVLSVTIGTLAGDGNDQGNDQGNNNDQDNNRNAPVSVLSAISVPGNPITSADISWADPETERYYFADRSNAGVDIIDGEKDVWVSSVASMAG